MTPEKQQQIEQLVQKLRQDIELLKQQPLAGNETKLLLLERQLAQCLKLNVAQGGS